MATAPNPRRLSLEEYLAIERRAEYRSEYSGHDALDDSLTLHSIAITLPLAEIYEEIAFAPEPPGGPRPRGH